MTSPWTGLADQEQLAARLKVSPYWVRDAVTARRIPITWVGRHARFSEADYQAIVAAGHEEPVRVSAVDQLAPRRRQRSTTQRRVA